MEKTTTQCIPAARNMYSAGVFEMVGGGPFLDSRRCALLFATDGHHVYPTGRTRQIARTVVVHHNFCGSFGQLCEIVVDDVPMVRIRDVFTLRQTLLLQHTASPFKTIGKTTVQY